MTDTNSFSIETRYRRAEAFMQGLRTQNLVQNDNIKPRWIEQNEYFWYPHYYKINHAPVADKPSVIGKEYRLFDVGVLKHRPAFDHDALAHALGRASARDLDAKNLPIHHLTLSLNPLVICFTAFDQQWQFDADSQTCILMAPTSPKTDANEILSPDGKQIAFTRDYNLWVREVSTGNERALTNDGESFFCYAAPHSAGGVSIPGLNAAWSPDSKRLFTLQRDTRQVKTCPLVNHIPHDDQLRPAIELIKLAMQGDKHLEQYRLLTINVDNAENIETQYPRMDAGADDFGFFGFSRRAWWAKDSRRAYFIDYQGDYKVLHLVELDSETGATRVLFEESSDTYVNFYPEYCDSPLHRYLPESDELIWWSERSGWGQLYLYDLNTGKLKHAITQIEPITNIDNGWRVRNILHVDIARRELWIQTAGRVIDEPAKTTDRNPYYRDICRVHIDTGLLTTLASSNHDYYVHMLTHNEMEMSNISEADGKISGLSPSANYIVATRSRADQVPVSLLLNRGGDILCEIETADISNLPTGWQWPEPVKMMATDNKTDIYGLLFRPSNFSEKKQYPVINMIVGGPWLSAVPQGSFHHRGYIDRYYFHGAALAELGFMVVIIDSRGTPFRSKSFQDSSYGWLPSGANSEDHRAAIEQLAIRYPSMDLNRVGVYSPTGYHGGLQNLFESNDFYRAGVINICMDSRLASCTSEHTNKYQGLKAPAKDKYFPEQLAKNWGGKLLLILPMLSAGYPTAGPLRVVDALQKANKEVDLLLSPHGWGFLDSYEQRRAWDYLVTHIQLSESPKEFSLGECQW